MQLQFFHSGHFVWTKFAVVISRGRKVTAHYVYNKTRGERQDLLDASVVIYMM